MTIPFPIAAPWKPEGIRYSTLPAHCPLLSVISPGAISPFEFAPRGRYTSLSLLLTNSTPTCPAQPASN